MGQTSIKSPDTQELTLLRSLSDAAALHRNAVRKLLQVESAWRTFAANGDPGDAGHEEHDIRMRAARLAYAGADASLTTAQHALEKFHEKRLTRRRAPSRKRVIAGLQKRINSIQSGAAA